MMMMMKSEKSRVGTALRRFIIYKKKIHGMEQKVALSVPPPELSYDFALSEFTHLMPDKLLVRDAAALPLDMFQAVKNGAMKPENTIPLDQLKEMSPGLRFQTEAGGLIDGGGRLHKSSIQAYLPLAVATPTMSPEIPSARCGPTSRCSATSSAPATQVSLAHEPRLPHHQPGWQEIRQPANQRGRAHDHRSATRLWHW